MNIKIIKYKKIWFAISIVLTVIGLVSIVVKQFNYGIDFTGGNMFQLKYEKKVDMTSYNNYLDSLTAKYPQVKSRKLQVSEGNTVILRLPDMEESAKGAFLEDVKKFDKCEVVQANRVGATVGKELALKALYAIIIGSLLIVAYVTVRFRFSFAVGGIVALIHDALVAAGFISLLGFEIDTAFVAAILTILGYSINDTIVVYDRTRENLKRHPEKTLEENIDYSVNQVMGRSINTVVTVEIALIALLIFGGESLRTFTITLLVGVTTGAYSSIFVASPIVYLMEKNKKKEVKGV